MANGKKIELDVSWSLDQKLKVYDELCKADQEAVFNEFSELSEAKQMAKYDSLSLELQSMVLYNAVDGWSKRGKMLFDKIHLLIPKLAASTPSGILLMKLLSVREEKPSTEGLPKIWKAVEKYLSD